MSRSIPPTRSGVVRAADRLGRVRKGADLLNRKREALVTELFRSAKPALDARQKVEERSRRAYTVLLRALAIHGQSDLTKFAWPSREVSVDMEHTQIWGIPVPVVVDHSPIQRSLVDRETAAASVGPTTAQTTTEFERFLELVLDALPKEQLVRRLGEALAKTTRQVNTLQQRVEPRLAAELATVRRVLEERERDEQSRLRHVLSRRRSQWHSHRATDSEGQHDHHREATAQAEGSRSRNDRA